MLKIIIPSIVEVYDSIRISIGRILLRKKNVFIAKHSVFSGIEFKGSAKLEPYCRLIGAPRITIEDDFYLNAHCHLLGEIHIGKHVMIGPKTVIWGRDHGVSNMDIPMNRQKHINAPIYIEDNVWIGANVTILKGVRIGSGAVVGAGAVVTKNVEKNSIVGGNPGRKIISRADLTRKC